MWWCVEGSGSDGGDGADGVSGRCEGGAAM